MRYTNSLCPATQVTHRDVAAAVCCVGVSHAQWQAQPHVLTAGDVPALLRTRPQGSHLQVVEYACAVKHPQIDVQGAAAL